MPTERLHLHDSLLLSFEARSIRVSLFDGRPSIVLDRTAFYAEAGGQVGDRGVLSLDGQRVPVVDVRMDDVGDVHHLIAQDIAPAADARVQGAVEERHRRDQMSQHTGQHMLSRAFRDVAGVETISARLGHATSTIDLGTPALGRDVIAEAESRVNAAVIEDRPVRVLFPAPDELRALKLHSSPKVDRDIRVIEVDAFDLMACGGTHCQSTGQVGAVVVTALERYKGLTRVTFLAGLRALAYLREADEQIRQMTTSLTCSRAEALVVVNRFRAESKAQAQTIGQMRSELMRFVARDLLAVHPIDASGTTRVVVAREGDDVEALRVLASALTHRSDVVALVASKDRTNGEWLVVAERGATATFDAGRWLKAAAAAHRGRGGGRVEHAEGRFPADADWPVLGLVR